MVTDTKRTLALIPKKELQGPGVAVTGEGTDSKKKGTRVSLRTP